jgi:SagB-type dehydrogenase family enzyme
MPKVLWIVLPLMIVAAVLAVQWLRGRMPSRHAINVITSVLLLVYLSATAGLGIFWVANQQLPVFDWHYLFGYGTVLLVGLHLAFNFRVVWRFLTGERARPGAARAARGPAPAQPSRRSLLGLVGACAAAGFAFVLGLRHGRSVLTVAPAPGRDAAGADPLASTDGLALALVERFHAFSSHSRTGVLRRAPAVDWGERPEPFKLATGRPGVPLPPPGATRRTLPDRSALGDILWHTAGATERRGGLHLRASPSSGALFATELYLAVRHLPGLEPGLWHYEPRTHALVPLSGPHALADTALPDAPVCVVATAVFRRTGYKYGDRCYRYVLADLGHALENLRVTARSLGLQVRAVPAFDESRLARALQVDEAEEGVLALMALDAGTGASTPPPPLPPAAWRVAPVPSTAGAALGVTAAMHAATSLRQTLATEHPPGVPLPLGPRDAAWRALPRGTPLAADWLDVIAQRRSVRRHARRPLPLQTLADVLAHMVAPPGPSLSRAVRVHLVAHDVSGLAPGAYRYEPDHHALAPQAASTAAGETTRAVARAAALDQDVVGDAAVVFVLSIDRATLAADPLGPARGYRHAFLEAGMVGERVYLAAGALGLGACAVGAFHDDEAAALVGVDPAREWVVHFAALGMLA